MACMASSISRWLDCPSANQIENGVLLGFKIIELPLATHHAI
jgi:hypothetical protein